MNAGDLVHEQARKDDMPRYSKTKYKHKKKIFKCLVPGCQSFSSTFAALGEHMKIYHRDDFNIYEKDCPICKFAVNKKSI